MWDISVLYSGIEAPELEADYTACRAAARQAADYIAALEADGLDALSVLQALKLLDIALCLCSQVSTFANMVTLTDSGCHRAALLLEGCTALDADNLAAASALSRVIMDSGRAEALGSAPQLEPYRYYFERLGQEAAHAFSPEAETAVPALQQSGGYGYTRLRGRLEANMTARVGPEAASPPLPITQVRGLAFDGDPAVRHRGYLAELAAYRACEDSFAACINGIKGEALTIARLRGFDSVLRWMLFISRMEESTLEAMHKAVEGALPDFRRFIRAKARYLGHSGPMPYYDLNAPMGAAARRFTLAEAGDFLAPIMGQVNPGLGQFVAGAFAEGWIDAQPRAGKQGGALCVPLHTKGESRVFVNFDGSLPGVITLAHELGHAWHNRCTFHIPLLLRDAPTPLCETASTFHETLVYEQALRDAWREEQLFLLDALLSNAVRNIAEMYARFTFEDKLLAARREGELTARGLCALMAESQREAFGGSVDDSVLQPYLWLSKVHYYIPNFHYYSFPYTFGLLFSQGLYRRFCREGDAFFAPYCNMLAHTCTADVEQAGRLMDVDLGDTGFWQGALADFTDKIDTFIRLAEGGWAAPAAHMNTN